ncbi:hypothetical protein AURDEDRAFT_170288 [Auricularia subglabra TFB-10046 SS5]|nr:hypothetical protein AURDEDRAFT_170288 [Auricularia subglabra TFB-10046 SS5]
MAVSTRRTPAPPNNPGNDTGAPQAAPVGTTGNAQDVCADERATGATRHVAQAEPSTQPDAGANVPKAKAVAKGGKREAPAVEEGDGPEPAPKKRRGGRPAAAKKQNGKKKPDNNDVAVAEGPTTVSDTAAQVQDPPAQPLDVAVTAPLEPAALEAPPDRAKTQGSLAREANSSDEDGLDMFFKNHARGGARGHRTGGRGRGGVSRGAAAARTSMQELEAYRVDIEETPTIGDAVIDGSNRMHALQSAMSAVRFQASDVFKAQGKILPSDWDNVQTREIKTEIAQLLGLPTGPFERQPRYTGPPLPSSSEPEDDQDGRVQTVNAITPPIVPSAPPIAAPNGQPLLPSQGVDLTDAVPGPPMQPPPTTAQPSDAAPKAVAAPSAAPPNAVTAPPGAPPTTAPPSDAAPKAVAAPPGAPPKPVTVPPPGAPPKAVAAPPSAAPPKAVTAPPSAAPPTTAPPSDAAPKAVAAPPGAPPKPVTAPPPGAPPKAVAAPPSAALPKAVTAPPSAAPPKALPPAAPPKAVAAPPSAAPPKAVTAPPSAAPPKALPPAAPPKAVAPPSAALPRVVAPPPAAPRTRATAALSKATAAPSTLPKANAASHAALPKPTTAPPKQARAESDSESDDDSMHSGRDGDASGSTESEPESESPPQKKKPGPISNKRLAIWMNDANKFKALLRRRAARWGCTEGYLLNKAGVGQPPQARKRSPWNMYEISWFAQHQDDESDRHTKVLKCRAAYDAECEAAKTPEQKRALVAKLTKFCVAYEDGLAKEEVERVGAQNALRKLATPFYHRYGISIFGVAVSLRPGDIAAMAASCTFANNDFAWEIMQKHGNQVQKENDKDDFSPAAATRALAEAQTPRRNRLGHALRVLLVRVNGALTDAKRGVVLVYDHKLLEVGYRMVGWPTTVSTPMMVAKSTGHFATDEVKKLIPLVYAALYWREGQLPLPTLRLEKISQAEIDLKSDPSQWGKVPVWVLDNGKVHRYVHHVLGNEPTACETAILRPVKANRDRDDSAPPPEDPPRKGPKRKNDDSRSGPKEKKRRTASKATVPDVEEVAEEFKSDDGEKSGPEDARGGGMEIEETKNGKAVIRKETTVGNSVGSPTFTGNMGFGGVQDFTFPGNMLASLGTADLGGAGPSNLASGSHATFGLGQSGAASTSNQLSAFQGAGPMPQAQWPSDGNFMPFPVNDGLAPIVQHQGMNQGVNAQLQQQIAQLVLNQVMAAMGPGMNQMWGQNGGNGM